MVLGVIRQGPGVSEATPDADGNRVHAPGDRAPVDDHRGLHRGRRTAQRHRSLHPLHQISNQAPSLGKIRGSRRQLLLFGRQTGRIPPPKLPVGAHRETQPPRQQRGRQHGRRTCPEARRGKRRPWRCFWWRIRPGRSRERRQQSLPRRGRRRRWQ